MGHVVLGNGVGDQPVDDLYVATFSTMLKTAFELFPLLPVLLVSRIWYIDRKVTGPRANHRQSQLQPTLHILVDSGVIYSFTLIVALICFVSRSNGQYVMLDMVSPLCLAP